MTPNTIIIADCHEIVREGIAIRLSEATDIELVAECSDGYSTIKQCRQLNPEILFMDFGLLRPSGMETLAKIRKSNPETKIIVLSSDTNFADALFALTKGAVGFLPKQSRGSSFVHAVQAARANFSYLPLELIREFVASRRNLTRTGNAFGLSPREIEILEATVDGDTAKSVAEKLGISVRTVETHRNRIYKKAGCNSAQELMNIVELSQDDPGAKEA